MNHRTVFGQLFCGFCFLFQCIPVNLTISVVILSVMVVEFSNDTAGITYGKTICGDVLGYDAAGSDDGVVANGYAWYYDHAGAEPAVFADVDREIVLVGFFS